MIDVLYLKVTNKEWFELSLKTLEQHLFNYRKIYVLQTNQDLSQFKKVKVVNQSIFQFMKNNNITSKILVMEENMGLLKDISIQHIPTTYSYDEKQYIHDHLKPQLIDKEKFLKLPIIQTQNILTQYYKNIEVIGIYNPSFVVDIIKPICCKVKSLLKVKQYVKWNNEGFESLKKYLKL